MPAERLVRWSAGRITDTVLVVLVVSVHFLLNGCIVQLVAALSLLAVAQVRAVECAGVEPEAMSLGHREQS